MYKLSCLVKQVLVLSSIWCFRHRRDVIFIKKWVLSLNVSCLQYIENLDKLKKLQQLNLSSNMIERIEKLDKCLKLKDLNLSYNLITKIEGLENLMYLQVLNLTGNKIEHIPVWLAKRLRALRTLHLGKNNLQSVSKQDLFSLSIKHLVTSFFFF